MKDSMMPPWWWAAAFITILSLKGCLAQPASPAAQLAGDLYPGYTVLQLSPTKTSSIQEAIAEAQAAADGASHAFVIILNSNVGTLVVDDTLNMAPEDTWVITTAAALQAGAEGTELAAADLLIVRCGALKRGSFVAAMDGFDTLELLGMSIQECPSSAIDLMYGTKLVLSNTKLLNNNAKKQAEFGGGAVLLEEVGKVEVINSACKHNYVLGSGGCLSGTKIGEFTAVNSTFVGNWKSDEASGGRYDGGAALFFENSDRIAVTGSVFSDNTALYGRGGAIFCSNCEEVVLSSSVFTNNSAVDNGGGLFGGEVGAVTITDCNFTANGELPDGSLTNKGSAISFEGTRTTNDKPLNIKVQSSRFIDNLSYLGAFHAEQVGAAKGRVEVHDCVFSGNQGKDEGGAIFIDENQYTFLNLSRSTFTQNTALYGPAVDCYDCDAVITDCVFDTNTAESDGGALQFYSTQAAGSGNKLQIVRSKFHNNTSFKWGGAAAVYRQAVDIQESQFTLNLGGGGGAIYLENGPSLRITDTTVDENTSDQGSGGALRLNTVDELVLNGVSFQYNTASTEGTALGGAIAMFTVTAAAINNTNFTENLASTGGGAIAAMNSDSITILNGILAGNIAPLGAAIAVDRSTLILQSVQVTGNIAQEEQAAEEDYEEARRKSRRLQQATSSGSIFQFASEVYASTTAGAILAQQSGLQLQDCTLHNNTAGGDAGAVLLQQPTEVAITNTYFTNNVATSGMGAALVMRGTGAAAAAGITNCTFAQNTARLGSGGAAVIDSGLGVLDVTCEACIFEGNTAGGAGGAISANGPTRFSCTDCQSEQNTAGQQGGWMHCSGCSNTSITSGKSSNNSAGAAGGSISCTDCGTFSTKAYEYHGNTASSGGAVAVQTAADIAVTECTITENTAGNVTKAAVLSPLVKRVYDLPAAWQNMYGAGAATAGLGCNAQGAGGGLCMAGAEAANIADNTLTANQGSTGGALFASATCDASQPNCQSNKINVTNLTARRNKAAEAGGVLYTTTPNSVQLGASGVDPHSPEGKRQRAAIVQQLTEDNSVGSNGYGPAVASFPSELSLMWPLQEGKSTLQAAAPPAAAADAPGPGRTGRKLQQLPMPNNEAGAAATAALTDLKRKADNVYQIYSTAAAGTSKGLQPVCPDLGASILETHVFAVDGNTNFSLPINVLDDFGSKVLSGPGSNWIVALSQNTAGRQLTGAMRGQLSGGSVVLRGLSIQSEPGSNLTLMLSAIPPPGSGDAPLSATLQVRVRPCLAGEYVVFSNSSAGQTQSCSLCAAPMYSFTAYPPPGSTNSTAVCQSCPSRGICVAGMMIPESGCYQAHPRSAVIRQCPHTRACARGAPELLNLQGLQCSYRRYLNPEDIDPRPYTHMQCNRGYAGPFCSCCYRAGRNAWLLQQLERSGPHDKGYTIADEIVVTTGQTNFEPTEVYGKSNGRCTRCPHLALAWIGFILSRGLDLLIIACISLLWMGFGWLSQSAAVAAFVELKQQRMEELRLRRSILGTSSMASLASGTLSTGASLSKPMKSTTSSGLRSPNNSVKTVTTASRGTAAADAGIQAHSSVSASQLSSGIPLSFTGAGIASVPSSTAAASTFAAASGEVLPPVLSETPSAAGEGSHTLQGGRRKSSVLYNLNAAPSLHWASAVNLVETLRQHYAASAAASADGVGSLETADPLAVQRAALLLMAVKHLACLAQVVLDGAQIAAVLLSQDLMFYVPDWAATALSAVLLTQANTWQYMPFECLIPGGAATSAAVVQTVLVTLLPIIYVAALYPLLMSLLSLFEHWMARQTSALEQAQSSQLLGPRKTPASAISKPYAQGGIWSRSQSAWTILTTVIVAAMAYCYSFYVANVTAAFNCMSLTTSVTVPGEAKIKGMVWVPDMQLACTSPPQAAAMAIAAVIGIPMLVGYWMLLLTLAWPTHAASPAAIRSSSHRSPTVRALSDFWRNLKRACLIPFRMLEHPVRVLQRYTGHLGVSGESCAALDVWNVEWRWWWLAGREMMKLVLVVVATVTTMRGPEAQARVLLLLVVLAAAFSWRTQAGCGTSMNQLQFVVFCWLQLLALLVVVPSMSNVNAAAFGGFLVALVSLVMVQCGFVIACLVLRCLACTRGMDAAGEEHYLPQVVGDE